MRCEDLTRELASPTGHLSSAQMAEHLAGCPSCAGWSRQAAKLDRIWEETRPFEPTADAMDALWAKVSLALDEQPVPVKLRLEGLSRRRGWLRSSLFVAQLAAAVLVAALFLLRQAGNDLAQVAVAPPAPAPELVEHATRSPMAPGYVATHTLIAEPENPLFVRIDAGNQPTVTDSPFKVADGISSMLPDVTEHDLFNKLEVEATPASPSLASND